MPQATVRSSEGRYGTHWARRCWQGLAPPPTVVGTATQSTGSGLIRRRPQNPSATDAVAAAAGGGGRGPATSAFAVCATCSCRLTPEVSILVLVKAFEGLGGRGPAAVCIFCSKLAVLLLDLVY
jgi:hypothetical protein